MKQFDYKIVGDKTAKSGDPTVWITLNGFNGYWNGRILLSPNCMNEDEIDEEVNRMIKQLESVRKRGKNALRKRKGRK